MESVRNTVLVGDVRTMLRTLPAASVDCVITSPPYYLLRDYSVAGQIGLEDSIEGWVSSLRDVMADVARVLKDSGTVFSESGAELLPTFQVRRPSEESAPRTRAPPDGSRGRWLDLPECFGVGQAQRPALERGRSLQHHLGARLLPHPIPEVLLRPRRRPDSPFERTGQTHAPYPPTAEQTS